MLTQFLRDSSAQDEGGGSKKKKKIKDEGEGGERRGVMEKGVTWLKVEDECYLNHAHASFEFALDKEPEEGFHFFGKVMLFKASKLDAVRAELLELVGDEAMRNQEH